MSRDKTLFHGIYLYGTNEEKLIARLKILKDKSLLVLNEPKMGEHKHYYFNPEQVNTKFD